MRSDFTILQDRLELLACSICPPSRTDIRIGIGFQDSISGLTKNLILTSLNIILHTILVSILALSLWNCTALPTDWYWYHRELKFYQISWCYAWYVFFFWCTG